MEDKSNSSGGGCFWKIIIFLIVAFFLGSLVGSNDFDFTVMLFVMTVVAIILMIIFNKPTL